MTEKKFVAQIIRLYKKAKRPYFPDKHITRAEGRPIPSIIEDLLAKYLAEATRHKYEIIINKLLICNDIVFPNKIKTDLTFVQNGKIIAFVDVKTELGYKRKEFVQHSRVKDRLVLRLRGKQIFSSQLSISKNIRYHIVLISSKNIPIPLMAPIEKKFKRLKASTLYILTRTKHPNQRKLDVQQTMSAVSIEEREFRMLVTNIAHN